MPVLTQAEVWAHCTRRYPYQREATQPAHFEVGQTVRARNLHRASHCRLPGYAKGKTGLIIAHHGAFILPDANAHGGGEQTQHLYTVRFEGRVLWGEDAGVSDPVLLDLWEGYLQPA